MINLSPPVCSLKEQNQKVDTKFVIKLHITVWDTKGKEGQHMKIPNGILGSKIQNKELSGNNAQKQVIKNK